MYNTLQELQRLERKIKTAKDLPEIYYFPKHLRHWANVGVGLYIAELDVIFIDNKLKRGQKIANKLITLYLILHELAHSTAHPKRLHRRYMATFGFDSMRSLNKYIREWDIYIIESQKILKTMIILMNIKKKYWLINVLCIYIDGLDYHA